MMSTSGSKLMISARAQNETMNVDRELSDPMDSTSTSSEELQPVVAYTPKEEAMSEADRGDEAVSGATALGDRIEEVLPSRRQQQQQRVAVAPLQIPSGDRKRQSRTESPPAASTRTPTPVPMDGEEPVTGTPGSTVESSASPLTATWSTALFNKNRLRSFLTSYHWRSVHQAEAGLYAGVLYVLVDSHGSIEAIMEKRPLLRPGDGHTCVRAVLLGTSRMFFDAYAPRHFCLEFVSPSRQAWSPGQRAALELTQRLVNHTSPLCAPRPEAPVPPAQRTAAANLRALGAANIPQTSATLFVDAVGAVQAILYGRPAADALGFVGDADAHLHVMRVEMTNGVVSVTHPFEAPTGAQAAVGAVMQRVLQQACASHAARYEAQRAAGT